MSTVRLSVPFMSKIGYLVLTPFIIKFIIFTTRFPDVTLLDNTVSMTFGIQNCTNHINDTTFIYQFSQFSFVAFLSILRELQKTHFILPPNPIPPLSPPSLFISLNTMWNFRLGLPELLPDLNPLLFFFPQFLEEFTKPDCWTYSIIIVNDLKLLDNCLV